MTNYQIDPHTPIHCNRCHQPFQAPRILNRDGFGGEEAARIAEFCTCLNCQQTDCHWLFASTVAPIKFEGNYDARKQARHQWLIDN